MVCGATTQQQQRWWCCVSVLLLLIEVAPAWSSVWWWRHSASSLPLLCHTDPMTAMRMPDDLSTGVEFNFQFQIIKHFCYVRYGEKLSPTQLLYSSKVTKKESTRMDVKEADVEVEVEDDVDLELQQQRGGNGDENSSDDQQKGSPHTTLVSEEPATASLPSENPKRESSPDETEPRVRKWDPENLYLESATMLLGSFLMFCLPDLRAVARQGLLKGDPEQIQRILDLPATVKDISTIYSENKELLTAERLKDPDRAQMYEDALALTFDKGYLFDEADRDHAMKNSILVALDDANEQENCVYMISFNPYKSRVGVYFRGSVTSECTHDRCLMSALSITRIYRAPSENRVIHKYVPKFHTDICCLLFLHTLSFHHRKRLSAGCQSTPISDPKPCSKNEPRFARRSSRPPWVQGVSLF